MLQQQQQRQVALSIMRSTLDQRRSCTRIRLTVPAEVTCPGYDPQHHTALVRDISTAGAFFFSNFIPDLGSNATLEFVFPVIERLMKVSCSGVIVRVENAANGCAAGIAMQFRHYDIAVC